MNFKHEWEFVTQWEEKWEISEILRGWTEEPVWTEAWYNDVLQYTSLLGNNCKVLKWGENIRLTWLHLLGELHKWWQLSGVTAKLYILCAPRVSNIQSHYIFPLFSQENVCTWMNLFCRVTGRQTAIPAWHQMLDIVRVFDYIQKKLFNSSQVATSFLYEMSLQPFKISLIRIIIILCVFEGFIVQP